jgi:DNA polymerase-3 subunit delta'
MLLEDVVGHGAVKHSLRRALDQGKVSHAYLFTGPSAVGKFTVALSFAASMLCPSGGCGECNVCRRVLEEKHPDVAVIRPAGKNIPVELIREMRLSAFLKPMEADRKVYIIKNADRMWEEGASTLLKVLEEPPGDVVFILIATNRGGLLSTVRSRCREITFTPLPAEELARYLVEHKGVSADDARLIVRQTGGVLGRALDWCDERWRLTRRENVIKVARELRRADLNTTLEMAQDLHREVEAPLEELGSIYQERKSDLADGSLDEGTEKRISKALDEEWKREQIKEELRGVKEILSTLAWWYRDILIVKEGGDAELLTNLDLQREIAVEAEGVSTTRVIGCIELLEDSMRAAEQNVSAQLNIESTLLGIQEVLYA